VPYRQSPPKPIFNNPSPVVINTQEKITMSIAGYFQKRTNPLRMPTSRDSTGIRYDGPVLTGEKSVEQAQRDDQIRAFVDPTPRILEGILSPERQSLTAPGRLDSSQRGLPSAQPEGALCARYKRPLPGKFPPAKRNRRFSSAKK
jgi:hypothetical protein